MASRKKPKRPRAERRAAARRLDKLAAARAKLQSLEPGGSPDNPIELRSASQLMTVARSLRCARCDEGMQPVDESAEVRQARVHRTVTLSCRRCGARRVAHFVVVEKLLQ